MWPVQAYAGWGEVTSNTEREGGTLPVKLQPGLYCDTPAASSNFLAYMAGMA